MCYFINVMETCFQSAKGEMPNVHTGFAWASATFELGGISSLKRHELHYFLRLQRKHHSLKGASSHQKSKAPGHPWPGYCFRYILSPPLAVLFSCCNVLPSHLILFASKKPSSPVLSLHHLEPEDDAVHGQITIPGTMARVVGVLRKLQRLQQWLP